MHGLSPRDGDLAIDWSLTAPDYARFRPGYPGSFWARLAGWGIGRPGQRVLDLGTGTGNIARPLARRGARVLGIDIAPGQIEQARRLAADEGLEVAFAVARAEAIPAPAASFDLATASQCWLYFDKHRTIDELRRVLVAPGRFLTCHLSWLPLVDPIAGRTEELVLRHNPEWTAGGFSGEIPAYPGWAREAGLPVEDWFCYDEPLPFTRESWRGRIRACRGVGATLSAAAVAAFDADLDALLGGIAGEEFTILHRIDAHRFRL